MAGGAGGVRATPLRPRGRGPYGPLGGIRPRQLWLFVLFFSGMSYAGYLARLFVGARHGYLVAGLLGGIASSTSVTLSFARASRHEAESVGRPLAYGVLAACTVLFVRVLAATAVLSLPLAVQLAPLLAPPFLAGVAAVLIGLRRPRQERPEVQSLRNPLQIGAALQMAALFQAVLFAVDAVRSTWGDVGLIVTGAILGLADVDALMISMAQTVASGGAVAAPAMAVAVGILSNTLFKLALAVSLSHIRFDTRSGWGSIIGTLMNWRSRTSGIATGDQAIFVRRHIFERLGGFADIPLMEDIEFNRRLKRAGATVPLRQTVTTSFRRWEQQGPLRTILLMWTLRFLYWAGVNPSRLSRWYETVR